DGEVRCPSSCICYKPQDWETMDISLNFLWKVKINNLSGAECEMLFVERLLTWVPVLKTITPTFDPSVTVSEEVEAYDLFILLQAPMSLFNTAVGGLSQFKV
ncbi:hypothetical protein E2562_031335, partial [Oryza meyeriana var. granulata]